MRLIIAFFLCVLATAGYAQFPASQQTGAPKTIIRNKGGAAADSGTVLSVNFTDTTQANLGFLKGVPNIVIVANDTLWRRNNAATQWVKVGAGGGGSTVDSFFYQLRQLNDTTVLFDRGDGVVDTLAISGSGGGGGSGLNKVDSVTTVGDSLFYWINGDSFFSANLALSVVDGDTSALSVVDSTGQPARRVLFSAPNNKISSTKFFLYDTVNNKLVIGTPIISAGTGSKLFVNGNASFQGNVIADTGYLNRVGLVARTITFNSDSMRVNGLDQVADTSRFKPQVYDPINKTWSYFDRWPVTPSIDTTSLSDRINLKLNISDTAAMLSPYLKVADTVGTGSLYIRNQFATQEAKAFNIRSGRLDSLYAGGSGGVHFATNTGASAFEYGGGGGTQVTFNGFAGYNANRAASYTARSFTDKNYVDSSIAAGGGGGITIDSVAVRRIPQGTFNHYVGFNSGVGGTGTNGGNVTTDNIQAGENLVMFKDAGLSFRNTGRFDGNNMLIGTSSGKWATNQAFLIGIGFQTIGGANASIADSLWTTTGAGGHIGIGYQALARIKGNDGTQSSNVAIGARAMDVYTGCGGCTSSQVAIGTDALGSLTTGVKNTAVGSQALTAGTTFQDNTAIGNIALQSATGNSNTAVGGGALQSLGSGTRNQAVGYNAGYGVSGSASDNTLIGWQIQGGSGSRQVALGSGSNAGTSGSDNIAIGASIGVLSSTASNQFSLGSNSVRWLISDVSGSSRRWTFNGTTSDITATEASAALEVRSTSGGVLLPRMTATQGSAIASPADGLMIYVTDTNATFTSVGFWGRENGAWVKL